MFWLRNKKNNFQLSTRIWGPALSDSAQLDQPVTGDPQQSDRDQHCYINTAFTHFIMD